SLDLWIVTSAASGIQDLRQLRGKRVSLGTRGGETSRMAAAVLDSYGMQGAAVERRFLSVSQAADALSTGRIDVLFYLTGGMGTALARLAESHSLQLLGIDDAVLEGLCAGDPGRRASSVSIHEGAKKVPTLLVETLLVCKESLPPDRVAGILRAVRLAAKTSAILEPRIPEAGEPPIHPGAADA
ncbi:MAG: TAXI family TRAP transporter solute-binding subunit, partial [Spirochaetota bacterium]